MNKVQLEQLENIRQDHAVIHQLNEIIVSYRKIGITGRELNLIIYDALKRFNSRLEKIADFAETLKV